MEPAAASAGFADVPAELEADAVAAQGAAGFEPKGRSKAKKRAGRPARESPLLILKVGTSSLMTSDSSGQIVQLANIARLVALIAALRRKNYQVVLVSSGAVGMGCIKLGIPKPTAVRTKQAVAAAGQSHLMRMYEDLFGTVRVQVAQLLLSQSDFMDKNHWSNVKHTILECLKLGLVPIINENDTTNTEELRFGDNDNLASLTAVQLEADWLFLFTDVDYLYTANPRSDPSAEALRVVREPWSLKVDTRDAGSGMGTGGMETKIVAARTASCAGILCGLVNGQEPERLHGFLDFNPDAPEAERRELPHGTYFMAMEVSQEVGDTRRWILSLIVGGEIVLDDGAARAVGAKKSLLPAGVLHVSGSFTRGEAVRLMHRSSEVARAIVNFTAEELTKIRGKNSTEFEDILGFTCGAEACDRSNIIFTASAASMSSQDAVSRLPRLEEKAAPASGMKRNNSFS